MRRIGTDMKSIRRTTKISASRLALAAAAALLLSACTQDGGFLAGLGVGLGAGGGEKPAAEAPAEGSADGKAADESAAGAPAPAEAQEATLPPPPPIAAPAELIGRESAEVAALLGAPSFERRDGPAEIWQYRGAACILDVFLYKEQLGRLVRHAELRRRNGNEISDLDCLTDLFAARADRD